jgi:hypothetical protein
MVRVVSYFCLLAFGVAVGRSICFFFFVLVDRVVFALRVCVHAYDDGAGTAVDYDTLLLALARDMAKET